MVGEDVLITGAGPIGAWPLVANACRRPPRGDHRHQRLSPGLCQKLGATRTVNVSKETLGDVQKELGMTEGFDVGLEMSGAPRAPRHDRQHEPWRQDLDARHPTDRMTIDWNKVVFNMLTIKGIYGREMFETWYKMTTLIQSGLDLSPIITHRIAVDAYISGLRSHELRQLRQGRHGLDVAGRPEPAMPLSVFAAVLLGAALHATWNAIVKGGSDKLLTTVLVAAASGLVAVAACPSSRCRPRRRPFIAASAVVQVLYFALVAGAYSATDMSRAYPLMRGLAPALVAAAGVASSRRARSPAAWTGVALISGGVFGMTLRLGAVLPPAAARLLAIERRRHRHLHPHRRRRRPPLRRPRRPRDLALPAERRPARRLGAPRPPPRVPRRRAPRLAARPRRRHRPPGSYGLALWAMTHAPVAAVAALRETSILFGWRSPAS